MCSVKRHVRLNYDFTDIQGGAKVRIKTKLGLHAHSWRFMEVYGRFMEVHDSFKPINLPIMNLGWDTTHYPG